MIRRPPRSTRNSSSAASDVYKRQYLGNKELPVKEKLMAWEFGTLNDYIFLSEPTNAPRKSSKRKKQARIDPETDSDLISSVLNSLMPWYGDRSLMLRFEVGSIDIFTVPLGTVKILSLYLGF